MEIGKRLKLERERLGFSQAAFARFLGITRQALAPIEDGGVFKASILEVAATLGVDVQFVVTGVRSANHAMVQNQVAVERQTINGSVSGVGFAQAGSTVITTNRHETKVIAQTAPGKHHISVEQRAALHKLVDDVVAIEKAVRQVPKSHRAVWAAVNRHCGAPTHSLIALADFERAERYLRQWIGRLNSSASAHEKVGIDLRTKRYKYIKVNTKSPEAKEKLDLYLQRKFKVSTISALSNDELDQAYRYVASLKRP